MQREQRPQRARRLVVLDEVERQLDTAARFGEQLLLMKRHTGIEGIPEGLAQSRRTRKNLVSVQTEEALLAQRQEAANRLRNEHRAAVGREEQDAVLKVAQNLVEVLLQGGEDLLDIAHARAKALNLSRDGDRHVLAARLFA